MMPSLSPPIKLSITIQRTICNLSISWMIELTFSHSHWTSRYSGITEKTLQNVTRTLRDVQAVLLSMFNSKTILIGHSLESDFKALKLIHGCVVDTSILYPHKMGPPMKRALKNLCIEHLKRIIQEDGKFGYEKISWKKTIFEYFFCDFCNCRSWTQQCRGCWSLHSINETLFEKSICMIENLYLIFINKCNFWMENYKRFTRTENYINWFRLIISVFESFLEPVSLMLNVDSNDWQHRSWFRSLTLSFHMRSIHAFYNKKINEKKAISFLHRS